MRNIVLVDLDHTLSYAQWRDHMLGDWDKYHAASIHDEPCEDMQTLIKLLAQSVMRMEKVSVIGISSRSEKWRTVTNEWLCKHDFIIDELLLRPEDNYQKAPDLKLRLVEEFFGPQWQDQILCIIDDSDAVTQAFCAAGVMALQCYQRRNDKNVAQFGGKLKMTDREILDKMLFEIRKLLDTPRLIKPRANCEQLVEFLCDLEEQIKEALQCSGNG